MPALTPDSRLLFSTRIARLFAYGFLSVVLVLFFLAGSIKIIYDLMLYRNFKAINPPEEKK